MIRYYLADLIGDGSEGNEWRPSVANYAVSWGADSPCDVDGIPLNNWSLVEVSGWTPEVIVEIEKDPAIDPLPFVEPDTEISSLDMTNLIAALNRRGIALDVLMRANKFGELVSNLVFRAANPL